MRIRNVRHKGLRRFMEHDDASGVPAQFADKLRKMMAFLQDMAHEDELSALPSWKPHRLGGDRRGDWSLSVSRNWRLTFRMDHEEIEIVDLDFEDYH